MNNLEMNLVSLQGEGVLLLRKHAGGYYSIAWQGQNFGPHQTIWVRPEATVLTFSKFVKLPQGSVLTVWASRKKGNDALQLGSAWWNSDTHQWIPYIFQAPIPFVAESAVEENSDEDFNPDEDSRYYGDPELVAVDSQHAGLLWRGLLFVNKKDPRGGKKGQEAMYAMVWGEGKWSAFEKIGGAPNKQLGVSTVFFWAEQKMIFASWFESWVDSDRKTLQIGIATRTLRTDSSPAQWSSPQFLPWVESPIPLSQLQNDEASFTTCCVAIAPLVIKLGANAKPVLLADPDINVVFRKQRLREIHMIHRTVWQGDQWAPFPKQTTYNHFWSANEQRPARRSEFFAIEPGVVEAIPALLFRKEGFYINSFNPDGTEIFQQLDTTTPDTMAKIDFTYLIPKGVSVVGQSSTTPWLHWGLYNFSIHSGVTPTLTKLRTAQWFNNKWVVWKKDLRGCWRDEKAYFLPSGRAAMLLRKESSQKESSFYEYQLLINDGKGWISGCEGNNCLVKLEVEQERSFLVDRDGNGHLFVKTNNGRLSSWIIPRKPL